MVLDSDNLRDFAANLQQAVRAAPSWPFACTYRIPTPPPPYVMVSTTELAVIYTQGGSTPVLLTEAPLDDCAQGGQWYYSAADPVTWLPTQIDLCPDMCNSVQSELDVSIEIQFACVSGV
jgi:hypothetical protein